MTTHEVVEKFEMLYGIRTGLTVLMAPIETLDVPVDPQVEEVWREELRKRTAAYELGEATLHDADDVLAEAARLTQ